MVLELRWSTALVLFRYVVIASCNKDIEQHNAWKILDEFECGDSANDRIIGGAEAALGQLPWIARLGYTGSMGDEIEWLCGGALLTNRHIITAAHCLQSDHVYKMTHVRLGEHDISNDPDCRMNVCAPPVQDRKVKKIIPHESFNKPPFQNDIALIELAEPVELNDYVAPLCLPRNEEQLKPLSVGDVLIVAGWGKTNMTTEEMANVLQFLQIIVLNANNCSVFNKRFTWSPTQICAGGEKDKDACAGDSGGPLTKVFDTIDGPKHILEGVVSFGPAICGTGNLPGIYVSAASYIKWILDNIVS